MVNVDRIMKGPRLKVERAKSHLDSLISLSSPLSKELYEITVSRERTVAILAKPDCFDVTFRPKKPIPEFFALIIGDAVHNLRASLDHWAAALVSETTGNPVDTRVYFPFYGEGKKFESAKGYKPIKQAAPDVADFIGDEIKPGFDGDRNLWSITDLDNVDKHNFILPTVAIAKVTNLDLRWQPDNFLGDVAVGGYATGPIRLIRSEVPFAIGKDFKTSTEITFPKGGLFENEPVIPTITNLGQVVTKTLDALEVFLRKRP